MASRPMFGFLASQLYCRDGGVEGSGNDRTTTERLVGGSMQREMCENVRIVGRQTAFAATSLIGSRLGGRGALSEATYR